MHTIVAFKYDPFGRRIQKSPASGTINYLYDGPNIIAELDGSTNTLARYAQRLGTDQPLAMFRGGITSFYQADGLGSITSLTSVSGTIAATYNYDTFGRLTASTGFTVNPFQYTSRESDSETGLYYYRARFYDSSAGRFVSEDPLRFNQGLNFYAYVGNDPTDLIDPTGLAKCCPSSYEKEIESDIANAKARLEHLRKFGTAVLPTDAASVTIGGMNGCNSGTVVKGTHIKVPDAYAMTIEVDPKKHPCTYECTLVHEKVHERMCQSMGGTRYNALTEAQQEIPAYTKELGCYLKMQYENGLGPYSK